MFRHSDQSSRPEPKPPAKPAVSPNHRRRWLLVIAVCCFLGAGYQLYQKYLNPPPPAPTPADWNGLEPFVHAYLLSQVQWVEEAPRKWDRHAVLGLAYAANGLWEPAQAAFQNAARLNPDEPLAALYAAVALEFAGEREAAVEGYLAVTQRFPEFAPAVSRLAEAQLRLARLDEAAAAFERLRELLPEEWRAYAGLAETRLTENDPEAARVLAEQAVRLAPTAAPAHYLLGLIEERLGQSEAAQRELRLGGNTVRPPLPDEWSRQAPAHMRREADLIVLAQEFLRHGEPDRAIALLQAALAHQTNSVGLLTFLGLAQQQAGRQDQAAARLEAALRLDPRQVPALVGLAAARLLQGNAPAARELADRAIQEGPELPQPYLAKANVALAEDQDEEALAALEKAASLAPESGQIQMDIANVLLLNQGLPEAALPRYQRAVALEPALIPAHVRIAQILGQQGQTDDALAAIRAALAYAPGDTNLLSFEAALLNPTAPTNALPPPPPDEP